MSADILSQVALSYCPIVDPQRRVTATRLSVFPLRPGQSLEVGALLTAVSAVWSPDSPPVLLSVRSEDLLSHLLEVRVGENVHIEVPAFMAADAALHDTFRQLSNQGAVLVLSGVSAQPLAPALLACFRYALVDLADERRREPLKPGKGPARTLGFYQSGVQNTDEVEAAFARGAQAVVGWPTPAPVRSPTAKKAASRPDLSVTIELMNKVDEGASVDVLDRKLRSDPTLAYKLMRYMNSPIFGLKLEVESFAHAIRMLGYQRLKRWLALLLVTADSAPDLRPVMCSAVRRGLIMERLADQTLGESARSEMFICGMFSLLDCMLQEPLAELLLKIPVPEPVLAALVDQSGPLAPLIRLVALMEGGAGVEIHEAAEAAMLSMRDANQALLAGLAGGLELG